MKQTIEERVQMLEQTVESIIQTFNKRNEMLSEDFTKINGDLKKLAELIAKTRTKKSKIIF